MDGASLLLLLLLLLFNGVFDLGILGCILGCIQYRMDHGLVKGFCFVN